MRAFYHALAALWLAVACIAQPAEAGRFRTVAHHVAPVVGGGGGGGTAFTFDNRFGTDPTTAAATGRFTFTPSGGVLIYWVNPSGSDSNNCTAAATPCATLDHLFALTDALTSTQRLGMHVRIAQDNSYTQAASGIGMFGYSGISTTYPTVFESYDATDPTNAAKYGWALGTHKPKITLTGDHFGNAVCAATTNVAFQGLEFDGADGGITWQCDTGGIKSGIVWQNNTFDGVQLSFDYGEPTAVPAEYMTALNVSFNTFAQRGMFVAGTNGLYIQGNVFWHCSWDIGASRDDTTGNGGPSAGGHGHYLSAMNLNLHVDNNDYADTSADGNNLRGNGEESNLASLDEPIAGNLGGFSGPQDEAYNGVTNTVQDWAIAGGADISSSQPRGVGPNTTNTLSGSYLRNVAAFDNPMYGGGNNTLIVAYNPAGAAAATIVSITHSGTTATVTVSGGHGLTNGQTFAIGNASPNDYNAINAVATVIDSTHFTYITATIPATDATSVGIFSREIAQYTLLDKIHAYHYASALDGGANAFNIAGLINNTWTNAITDTLAPGAGNQVASGALFPNYKTRDQIVTAVLNGVGITPGANYYIRKGQLENAEMTRPDLPWAQWFIKESFAAMGLTPTYTTPAYQTFTDTPLSLFVSTMGNLTPSATTFTHGVGGTLLLSGASALPVLSSSDLPSGWSLSGRVVTVPTSVVAGTYTFHIRENSQDLTATPHDTTLTITVS